MREAVIVSTARTPIGKAYRGAFNDTQPQTLAGARSRKRFVVPNSSRTRIEDVLLGTALQQGATGGNAQLRSSQLFELDCQSPSPAKASIANALRV